MKFQINKYFKPFSYESVSKRYDHCVSIRDYLHNSAKSSTFNVNAQSGSLYIEKIYDY